MCEVGITMVGDLGTRPLDLRISTLDESSAASGLKITNKNSLPQASAQPSAAEIDIGARYLAAFFAGPARIAEKVETDYSLVPALKTIAHEYDVILQVVAPRGTHRQDVVVGVSTVVAANSVGTCNVTMGYTNDDGVRTSVARLYMDEVTARSDADKLRAMLRDPEWDWAKATLVWLTWLTVVAGAVTARQWLDGQAFVLGLQVLSSPAASLSRARLRAQATTARTFDKSAL